MAFQVIAVTTSEVVFAAAVETEHGLGEVEQLDAAIDGFPLAEFGMRDNEGRIDHVFVKELFRHQTMVADHGTVVGKEDDDGVLPQA